MWELIILLITILDFNWFEFFITCADMEYIYFEISNMCKKSDK